MDNVKNKLLKTKSVTSINTACNNKINTVQNQGYILPTNIVVDNKKHNVELKAIIFDYDKTLSESDV